MARRTSTSACVCTPSTCFASTRCFPAPVLIGAFVLFLGKLWPGGVGCVVFVDAVVLLAFLLSRGAYAWTHTHAHAHVHAHVHTHTHTHTQTHMYTHTHSHKRIRSHTHTNAFAHSLTKLLVFASPTPLPACLPACVFASFPFNTHHTVFRPVCVVPTASHTARWRVCQLASPSCLCAARTTTRRT